MEFLPPLRTKKKFSAPNLDYSSDKSNQRLRAAQIEPNDRLRQFVRIIYDFFANNTRSFACSAKGNTGFSNMNENKDVYEKLLP